MSSIVTDFTTLHAAFEPFRTDKRWVFRGQSNAAWPLLPKAGRAPYSDIGDRVVFETWKRRAVEYVTHRPASDWDWLAIAQHHGLATRLLDWTFNPLNAAYFAVREASPSNAVVYAVLPKYYSKAEDSSPMDVSRIEFYRPNGFAPRIVRQAGLFSVHTTPFRSLQEEDSDIAGFKRFEIANSAREEVTAQLAFYGISAATLFPDLDGLSLFVNWSIAGGEYFRKPAPI
jgi:hypothetical protein